MTRRWLWAGVYLALLLLPVAIGVGAARVAGVEPRPWLDEWAAGLGMVGFAAVLLSFFLLGRFKLLSGVLGSDLLMQSHQLFARTAVLLLLLHPFFYSLWGAAPGPLDPSGARTLRIEGGSWGLTTGLLALGCLLVLALTAVLRDKSGLAYERWRLMHSALALSVLGLGLHHTLVSGRYAQLTPLALAWWTLAALALASWAWVYAVRPLLQGARPFRVDLVRRCAEGIWLLQISAPGRRPLRFRAGQFAWLKLQQRWPHRDNPFSICNAPDAQGRVQFLIKEVGDMTRALPQCPVGATAYLDGPHGRFEIPASARAVVMYAGGIGIAPFLSLLADCVARQDRRQIRLVYADKCLAQMVDVAALSGAQSLHDFELLTMVEQADIGWTGLSGRLDAAGLVQAWQQPGLTPGDDETCHLVCGPEAMMDAVETALTSRGVPSARIISEHFKYDFAGRSPQARNVRRAWLVMSVATLAGLLLALVWRF
jgi:predicted ferric reductase